MSLYPTTVLEWENVSVNYTFPPYHSLDNNLYSIIVSSICMVLGFIGNLLVIIVKLYRRDLKSNVAVYYITSLAISDLMISGVYAPSILLQNLNHNEWVLGEEMCKVFMFIRNLAICISVQTLTAIAFDRYQVICKPFEFASTTKRTRTTILLIWIVGFCICLPNLFLVHLKALPGSYDKPYFCSRFDDPQHIFSRTYTTLTVIILYILPSLCMMLCYLSIFNHLMKESHATVGSVAIRNRLMKERKKVAKTMLFVSFFFVICWGCYWSYTMWYRFRRPRSLQSVRLTAFWMAWLPTLSSAVNPVIYAFSGQLFHKKQKGFNTSKSRSFTLRSNTFNNTRPETGI
ncbi:Neuropeptide FF receptor 2 [Trichoplax sp. H2]|nr:Neuropeptide FF receptor 2 [Trichoplax sp. H2]|eukprot:RDD37394.1 Neuropeptide FF receptor 2 [Trichoplax sp. H2]